MTALRAHFQGQVRSTYEPPAQQTGTREALYDRCGRAVSCPQDTASGGLLWQRLDLGAGPPPLVANGGVYVSALLIDSNPDGAVLALVSGS
jgi:hypothetical protein